MNPATPQILDGFAADAITAAVRRLRDGQLLGMPTETVYGLAADAENDMAIARIFSAKGRPANHPLIVHVLDAASADHFAASVPDFAAALMAAFWPGPLTLILPRRAAVAAAAAGGQHSIGLRCPSHPVAQALLRACRAPGPDAAHPAPPIWGIAAPSANQFGRVSPTTAAHVQGEFDADLLILDGGPCQVGIESTIIDCTRGVPVLLRPGAISRDQASAACGLRVLSKEELLTHAAPAPRASGTLESHYAPRAKVRLMRAHELQAALDLMGQEPNPASPGNDSRHPAAPTLAVYARSPLRIASPRVLHHTMPDDASAAAQQLFAALRTLDAQGVQQIWIESPPASPAWDAVRDRLQRAAAS